MFSTRIIRKISSVDDPKLRDILTSMLEETERAIGETVTKKEFLDFVKATEENFRRVWQAIETLTRRIDQLAKRVEELAKRVDQLAERVDQLAEAQRRTEERLNKLAERVDQLAEAQRRTEERLNKLAERVDQLAEAQRRTEERLNKLAERVDQLAEAQRRTEERLNKLAERVDQLAEAQRRTEERLEELIEEHKKTRAELGGLSHTVGYTLEGRAYKNLPPILKEKFGIELTEPLRPKFIETAKDRYIEINIYGKGKVDGREVHIIGECKTKLGKNDIDKFLKIEKKLRDYLPGDRFLIMVTHHADPQVMKYADEKGIKLIFSYEFEF